MKTIFSLFLLSCLSLNTFSQVNSGSNTYKPVGRKDTGIMGKIFSAVDELPEFMGGQQGLMNYLSSSIRYPADAREKNKEGRVVVKFVVCTDGSLCNEEIVKSVDSSMDQEVLRVVKAMPNWKPAKQNGQAVKTYYTLPVTFKLRGQARDTSLPDAREYLVKKEEPQSTEPEEKIFYSVEHSAEFPGGMEALQKFLNSHLKYPVGAREDGLAGRAIVQFVVDRDGSIKDIVLVRDVPNSGFGKEAVRLVNSMPKWKPGTQNGQPVRMYYTMPVTFKLDR
ncbi:energy transducer TonB [Taibaiella lutea]|nr:energy transducer TonB [Taibaiella lutea]